MTTRVHIAAAFRSAVVPRHGAFNGCQLVDLARPVIAHALKVSGVSPAQIDEIVVSNAMGGGGNPARLVGLASGLPVHVAGLTIDRQCTGGVDAMALAASLIKTGQCEAVIVGGVESYSRRPIRLRTFADGRDPEPYDQPPFTPWADKDPDMTVAAGDLAKTLGISRQEQDAWAIESHRKALQARGRLSREIVAVGGCTSDPFTRDLSQGLCRRATSISGSVTVANSAVAADGAAFCVLVSDALAKKLNTNTVLFSDAICVGGDPAYPALAPVRAVRSLLARNGLAPDDLTVAEIMEAYAVQAIACVRATGLHEEIINKGGGALARGHPIGASGAVLAVRVCHELLTTGGWGLAAIAGAGGLGSAALFQVA